MSAIQLYRKVIHDTTCGPHLAVCHGLYGVLVPAPAVPHLDSSVIATSHKHLVRRSMTHLAAQHSAAQHGAAWA